MLSSLEISLSALFVPILNHRFERGWGLLEGSEAVVCSNEGASLMELLFVAITGIERALGGESHSIVIDGLD